MSAVVADTHAILWYLAGSSRLSPAGRTAVNAAAEILIASISLVEIVYLVEKGRLPSGVLNDILLELDAGMTTLKLVPLDRGVVNQLPFVPLADVPDLPDRIIAATAVLYQAPLVSRDRKIQLSSLITIW